MEKKQFFDKHYQRLVKEGIMRSAIFGTAVFFGTSFLLAFLYWMLAFGSIWLSLAIGAPIGAVVGILWYRLKYKPTLTAAARRVDRLGLEERTVTMLELIDDDSYIAQVQREDAENKLSALPVEKITFSFSLGSIIAAVITPLLCSAAIVLGFLARADVIPYGKELLSGSVEGEFEVKYEAGDGGELRGELTQTVNYGENTDKVLAVADEGWIFVRWDDGNEYPERYEAEVTRNITVKAIFEKINTDTTDDEDGDAADDTPFASQVESGGDSSDDSSGENNSDQNSEQINSKWEEKNKFIDGATYYKDYLELYYQYATGIFDSDNEIPPELIEFFETYFSGI